MGAPAAIAAAMLQCSFGVLPSTLVPLPTSRVLIEGRPAANIGDAVPGANIPPFGMCTSLSNPTVVAATTAALGILTPMPCIPVTVAWVPGTPTTLIGGKPGVSVTSKCTCAWGGIIQIVNPGAVRTMIG